MTSIQEVKPAIMKYNPVWREIKGTKISAGINQPEIKSRATPELLSRLNEIAKGYPFCIMYRTTEHDPL